MRTLFLVLLPLFAGGLLVLLLMPEPRPLAAHDPVLRDTEASAAAAPEPHRLEELGQPTVREAEDAPGAAPAQGPANGSPEIAWGDLVIRGVVVADGTGEPLPHYEVAAIAAGERPGSAAIPADRRVSSDDRGRFAIEGLPEPGPWDLYVSSFRQGYADEVFRRAISATASNPGSASPVEIRIPLGATIEWTAPLPEGVVAEDLWVEIVQSTDGASLGTNNSIQIRLPGNSVTATCRSTEAGPAAQIRAFDAAERFDWPAIKLASRDGLWSLVTKQRAPLTNQSRVVIGDPLKPRGRVTVRIELPHAREDENTAAERLLASKGLAWTLPHGDPGRDGLFWASSTGIGGRGLEYTWSLRSDGILEIGDLPVGQVEVGAIGQPGQAAAIPAAPNSVAPAYRSLSPRPGSYVPINLVRATAVHGDPKPVTVRMRKVR